LKRRKFCTNLREKQKKVQKRRRKKKKLRKIDEKKKKPIIYTNHIFVCHEQNQKEQKDMGEKQQISSLVLEIRKEIHI